MKVVDEKGKLFGKINVIDLLIIILIIAVIAVVGLKFLGVDTLPSADVTKLTYTVRVTAQNEKVVDTITQYVDKEAGKKDQLVAGGSLANGYVVDFWTEPTQYSFSAENPLVLLDPVTAAEAGLVDLCFEVEVYLTDVVVSKVGTQEIRTGNTHVVKTVHFAFLSGKIESCEWEPVEG